MKERKLNYIFHNPNSDEEAAEHLLKIFIEANQNKVEQAVENAVKHAGATTDR